MLSRTIKSTSFIFIKKRRASERMVEKKWIFRAINKILKFQSSNLGWTDNGHIAKEAGAWQRLSFQKFTRIWCTSENLGFLEAVVLRIGGCDILSQFIVARQQAFDAKQWTQWWWSVERRPQLSVETTLRQSIDKIVSQPSFVVSLLWVGDGAGRLQFIQPLQSESSF
jgi:hypothetical protein